MANYQEARVNLTNTQLSKLKSSRKKRKKQYQVQIKIFIIKNCCNNYFQQQDKQLK